MRKLRCREVNTFSKAKQLESVRGRVKIRLSDITNPVLTTVPVAITADLFLRFVLKTNCIYLLKEAMVVHLNHDWRKKKIKSTLNNGNNLSPYYMCQVQQ